MFWDSVAGVYDLFVNVINGKTHKALRQIVSDLIEPEDVVLECACGTGLLSTVIAEKCKRLTATDFALKMLKRAEKNCAVYNNIQFRQANILLLDDPDNSFDKVVAGNVKDQKGETSGFASVVGNAGADFKRQFTVQSYKQFFLNAGYEDVRIMTAEGRIPCAVAIMTKKLHS